MLLWWLHSSGYRWFFWWGTASKATRDLLMTMYHSFKLWSISRGGEMVLFQNMKTHFIKYLVHEYRSLDQKLAQCHFLYLCFCLKNCRWKGRCFEYEILLIILPKAIPLVELREILSNFVPYVGRYWLNTLKYCWIWGLIYKTRQSFKNIQNYFYNSVP